MNQKTEEIRKFYEFLLSSRQTGNTEALIKIAKEYNAPIIMANLAEAKTVGDQFDVNTKSYKTNFQGTLKDTPVFIDNHTIVEMLGILLEDNYNLQLDNTNLKNKLDTIRDIVCLR